MLEPVLLAITLAVVSAVALGVLALLLACCTPDPVRGFRWLRLLFAGCALVGGLFCLFSLPRSAVDPHWIQTLGTVPLAEGSTFSKSFAVHAKPIHDEVAFWVVLADEGDSDRLRGPLSRNERGVKARWEDMSIPWAVKSSGELVASGTGKIKTNHSAYREDADTHFVAFGQFLATPGRPYELSLHVARSIPLLANADAVVQVRAHTCAHKQGSASESLWRMLALCLASGGLLLLLFDGFSRCRNSGSGSAIRITPPV